MNFIKIISATLIAAGTILQLTSIIAGFRLKKRLPDQVRDKWLQVIRLLIFFFCGHLLFAFLLLHDFPYPRVLIDASIFFGGVFAMLLITLTKTTAQKIMEKEAQISKAAAALKSTDTKLSKEIVARRHTEQELQKAHRLFLKDLFEMMDEVLANRDQYTFNHAIHVATVSKEIGRELGLSEEDLESLELGCLVHDIGKTAIPDDVLLKPGLFDYRDKDIMTYHPLIGAKLIARHIQDDQITDIIINHHERLDGSGYPAGLKGDDIGLLPRIVAVADTYDALVSKRPYKKSLSHEKAINILKKEAKAGRLDSRIVRTLIKVRHSIKSMDAGRQITAGFMKDVELFRNRSYFREPLTDFYNYRYLFFLDDARLLKKNELLYDLILINFPKFGTFQLDIGYAVADQVLDELGENILKKCEEFSSRREHYNGSVMIFRKGLDYLIYSECEEDDHLADLLEQITILLKQAETDWHLLYNVFTQRYEPGFPVIQAICRLFEKTHTSSTVKQKKPQPLSWEKDKSCGL